MLFPHIHTNWTHGMLTCLKNLLCFIIKNIVRQSFRNWICHRWNIPFLERWNTFESFHMWNTKPPLTVKKSHDGFQLWNELNGCNEKDKLKTDPQVLENKRFHWIMKHGRRTKFDGNWFGFGKLKKINTENKVMNINKKNDQEHYLILFVENNKHDNRNICKNIIYNLIYFINHFIDSLIFHVYMWNMNIYWWNKMGNKKDKKRNGRKRKMWKGMKTILFI